MEISPKSVKPPIHPRVFERFGRTKGEIQVEKGDFRGDFGIFCWGVWTLFGNQLTYPPTFGKDLPKKTVFFLHLPLVTRYVSRQFKTMFDVECSVNMRKFLKFSRRILNMITNLSNFQNSSDKNHVSKLKYILQSYIQTKTSKKRTFQTWKTKCNYRHTKWSH